MRIIAAFLLPVYLLLSACHQPAGQADHKSTIAVKPAALPESRLGEPGTDNMIGLLNAYYELKDALVASDTSRADAAASRVLSAAETMHYNNGSPIALEVVNGQLDIIMKQSEALVNAKGGTLEQKRAAFEKVSDAMYATLKTAGMQHAGAYHQYCPMAFNEKGAYWLSHVAEIQNPYFGKKMLECGEVRDSL